MKLGELIETYIINENNNLVNIVKKQPRDIDENSNLRLQRPIYRYTHTVQ